MSPSPGDNAQRPLLDGRAGVVFTVLVSMVVLLMLWALTDHVAFVLAACCVGAAVLAAACVRTRAEWTELVGGPLDGERIPSTSAARPGGPGLVLAVPGGGRARYSPDGSGRLVYRGRARGR